MTTQTLERADGIAKLKEALDKIKEVIEASNGTFQVKMQVSVVIKHVIAKIIIFHGLLFS